MPEAPPATLDEAYSQTVVLIPAYNAAQTVGRVVEEVRGVSAGLTTIVVDDGSEDATARVALEAGAVVLKHLQNMGKGAALRTGFKEFLGRDKKAVITLDADGQHSPQEIPKLLECWLKDNSDIVIGTRKRDLKQMPILRIFTNTVSTWLVSLSAGRRIPDSQSGYRLLTRQVIDTVKTTSRGYGAESEILIKAAAKGLSIGSAPISTIYEDEKSYIHPLKQPLLFIGLIIKSVFWRFGSGGGQQQK
ncbi:MAG: glycosyltransferase family 2 protein [Candidatus Eisenbacteria bacterium]